MDCSNIPTNWFQSKNPHNSIFKKPLNPVFFSCFFFFVYYSNSNQTLSNIPPNHRGISGTTATDKKEEETCLVPLPPSTSYLHSNSTTTTTYDFRSPLLTSLFLTLPRSLWDPSFLFQPITAFSLLRIRVVSTAHAFLHLHSTALLSNHSPPFLLLTTPSLLLVRILNFFLSLLIFIF